MFSRARLGLWLLIGFGGIFPFVFILSLLNINPRNPTLGRKHYTITYQVEGRYEQFLTGGTEFTCNTKEKQKPDRRMLQCEGLKGKALVPISKDGTITTDVYPLFWVFLENPITEFGHESWNRTVRDFAGLLGEPGRDYQVRSLETFIWWNYTFSSQASYKAGIYDGDVRVASTVYDMTCGMLFDLVTHRGGYGRIMIKKTSFPISRNRYWNALYALLFAVLIIRVYRGRLRKAPPEKQSLALDRFHLAVAIAVAVAVDGVYDIWYFHLLGDWFTYTIHLAAFFLYLKYFRLWAMGLLLELIWPFAFMVCGDPNPIPGITYFPAMLLTLVLMLLTRPTPRTSAK